MPKCEFSKQKCAFWHENANFNDKDGVSQGKRYGSTVSRVESNKRKCTEVSCSAQIQPENGHFCCENVPIGDKNSCYVANINENKVDTNNNQDKDVLIFDSVAYGGGNSEAEAEDKEEMWLPVSETVEKYDYPEIVDDSIWDILDFGDELTQVEKSSLLSLLKRYAEVFVTKTNRLGYCPLVEHRIETGDAAPIKEPLRRFTYW